MKRLAVYCGSATPADLTYIDAARHVGRTLAKRGIADMQARGAYGLVVLGDPAYYSRFGFENDPALRYSGAPAEYFPCLSIERSTPAGEVAFAPAFSDSRTD